MSADGERGDGPLGELRLHLERLRDDGVWGLELSRRLEGPPRRADGSSDRNRRRVEGGSEPDGATRTGGAARDAPPEPVSASAGRSGSDEPSSPEGPPSAEEGGADGATGSARPELQSALFGPTAGNGGDGDGWPGEDQSLEEVEEEATGCTLCRLCEERTQVVFGVGDPDADLMFIGEAPGRDEDLQGEPFVGRAGKLLTKIIEAMDLRREDVYITNANKCRPPNNRNPRQDEIDACRPYLLRQIGIIRPEVIVLLGRVSVQSVLGLTSPLSKLRGRFQDWNGVPVMCTYHPAYLLRNPNAKKYVWEDMQQVMALLAER